MILGEGYEAVIAGSLAIVPENLAFIIELHGVPAHGHTEVIGYISSLPVGDAKRQARVRSDVHVPRDVLDHVVA